MARGRPRKAEPEGGAEKEPETARLKGWQQARASKNWGAAARRAARRRALKAGTATPLQEPFSKRLMPDTQAAIDAFLAKKAHQ